MLDFEEVGLDWTILNMTDVTVTEASASASAPSQVPNEKQRSATRNKMRDMLNNINQDEAIKSDPRRLHETMGKMNESEFVDGIETTREGKLDAQMFKRVAECHRTQTETIDSNDRRFVHKEFANLLGRNMLGVHMEDDVVRASKEEWAAFGASIRRHFKRSVAVLIL